MVQDTDSKLILLLQNMQYKEILNSLLIIEFINLLLTKCANEANDPVVLNTLP